MNPKPPFQFVGELPDALDELRQRKQWVTWDYTWNGKKWDKPPRHPRGGQRCNGYVPENWETFDVALETSRRFDLAGVGYSLSEDDNLTGIDLDHCYDPTTRTFSPLAAKVLAFSETYAEFSPGGDGLRLFAKGKHPKPIKNDDVGIEVYGKTRYLTVTGHQVTGTPDAIQDAPQTIAFLEEEAAKARPSKQGVRGHTRGEQNGRSFWHQVNDTALRQLDVWVPSLFPTARKQATGAWRVRSSDLGRGFEEDLSIHPDGIQDFGPETSRTALDLVVEYGPANTAKDAALWLCDAMQLEPSTLGWRGSETSRPPQHQQETSDRPTIVVTNRHLRDISSEALQAIQAANCPPTLFLRGNVWVRVLGENSQAEPLTATALKGILDRTADFMKLDKGGENPTRPPGDLAPDLLALPNPELPLLAGITPVPVFLPDGRLLIDPGYDDATGILVCPRGLDGVRSDYSVDDAKLWLLDELLGDFPFADKSGKAHTLALLLERFVRPLINSCTPNYLIDAPAQGTGKGLLTDVVCLIAMGDPAPVMALSRDEDEIEKRITSMLLTGTPVVLLDNVTALRSTALSAVLTTRTWRGRRLGRSEMVLVPNDATWISTGNNVDLSHEMTRRTIPIRLDAGMAHPEERNEFRHKDLTEWVREHRVELVSACLSLIQAWIAAGKPKGSKTLGRYESWAQVLGGILGVSGVSGVLEGRQRLHAETDRESEEWVAMCAAWAEAFQEPVTAGKLFADVIKPRNLILGLWAGRSHTAAMQRVGHALARNRDRVYGQWQIRAAGQDSYTKNRQYYLELKEAPTKHPKQPKTPHSQKVGTEKKGVAGLPGDEESCKTPQQTPQQTTQNTPEETQNTPDSPQNNPSVNDDRIRGCDEPTGVTGVSGVLMEPCFEDAGDEEMGEWTR
jgi:hypothetical protein